MTKTCQNSLRVASAMMTLKDIIFIMYIKPGLLPFLNFAQHFTLRRFLYARYKFACPSIIRDFAGKTSREKTSDSGNVNAAQPKHFLSN